MLGARASAVVFDGVVLLLTWWSIKRALREGRRAHSVRRFRSLRLSTANLSAIPLVVMKNSASRKMFFTESPWCSPYVASALSRSILRVRRVKMATGAFLLTAGSLTRQGATRDQYIRNHNRNRESQSTSPFCILPRGQNKLRPTSSLGC